MRRWREALLIASLFAALILFTVYGPGRAQSEGFGELGSTHSHGDEGALALQRWLSAIGYVAANLEYTEWQIPADARALLMLNPVTEPVTGEESEEILRWVRDGGTLIAIDERPQLVMAPNQLWQALQATTAVSDTDGSDLAARASVTQPLLVTPPVSEVSVHTNRAVTMEDAAYVTLLETRYGPTLIGRQEGRGYIYLGVSAHPFTNAGLQEPGSAALMLNLLARVPPGGTILFDEFHHGFGEAAAAAPSLRQIVLRNWWGWASLYALGIVALYLVLTGRRFGQPVPLQRDVARRSSAEYVESIAQLLQRAGKRQTIGAHFHEALKRRLARQHGVVATADDDRFVRDLVYSGAATEEQAGALRTLLADLLRPGMNDAELVRVVRAADRAVDQRGRLR